MCTFVKLQLRFLQAIMLVLGQHGIVTNIGSVSCSGLCHSIECILPADHCFDDLCDRRHHFGSVAAFSSPIVAKNTGQYFLSHSVQLEHALIICTWGLTRTFHDNTKKSLALHVDARCSFSCSPPSMLMCCKIAWVQECTINLSGCCHMHLPADQKSLVMIPCPLQAAGMHHCCLVLLQRFNSVCCCSAQP